MSFSEKVPSSNVRTRLCELYGSTSEAARGGGGPALLKERHATVARRPDNLAAGAARSRRIIGVPAAGFFLHFFLPEVPVSA
eukprot:7233332-Prymnesium_polylepis.1